jgi:hypothetical protein
VQRRSKFCLSSQLLLGGFAAATVVLAAASAGSGLSAIAIVIGKTRADLSASEPIVALCGQARSDAASA